MTQNSDVGGQSGAAADAERLRERVAAAETPAERREAFREFVQANIDRRRDIFEALARD